MKIVLFFIIFFKTHLNNDINVRFEIERNQINKIILNFKNYSTILDQNCI